MRSSSGATPTGGGGGGAGCATTIGACTTTRSRGCPNDRSAPTSTRSALPNESEVAATTRRYRIDGPISTPETSNNQPAPTSKVGTRSCPVTPPPPTSSIQPPPPTWNRPASPAVTSPPTP